jgi:peptide/nickel transport system substrate-binding protein/oligopeptide transport system substrate-binding protein
MEPPIGPCSRDLDDQQEQSRSFNSKECNIMAYEDLDNLIEKMPAREAAFFRKTFSRRQVVGGGIGAAAGIAGLGMFGSLPVAAQSTPVVFDDAAPPEKQILRVASDPTIAKVLDFYEMVYGRPGIADVFSEPLVRLSKNFKVVPGAATSWTNSEDGKTFTFTLDQNLMWSDGNPVTAADYVKTFQYSADPEHAWDFTWFWDGNIVNYAECMAGTVPLEELGVKMGANEYEVIFTTVEPSPYLPAKLLYSLPLSKAALETTGPFYNTNPETAVSSGPFIIEEWVRDQVLTYKRNEAYTGQLQVPLQKIQIKFAAPATYFTMYDSGEIDYMTDPAPAELKLVESDPDKASEIHQGVGDFACLYFFFDVTTAPWDNLQVRQAFSHVIDRDAMKQQIWTSQANPAPSFLAPGFPASNTEGLADIQKFDPDLGKQLLEQAGYPNGEGFPKITMQVRGGGTPMEVATTTAYASMLKEHLNIDVEVQTIDRTAFYDQMNAKPTEISFGWVSYGMDYFDASNMLGVWLSGGRHSWSNADYDAKVNEATTFLGDEAERTAMFQEAEKILVEDVPAVFTYFVTPIQLVKPYLTGPALEADENGIAAVHWPGFTTMSTVFPELYIRNDVPEGLS